MSLRRERERVIAGSVVLGGPHCGMEIFGENGEKLFHGDYSDCLGFGSADGRLQSVIEMPRLTFTPGNPSLGRKKRLPYLLTCWPPGPLDLAYVVLPLGS